MNIKNCPDCLNTEALSKYDPLMQEFEDDSIVDSTEGSETTAVTPKVLTGLLTRKLI